MSYRGLIVLVVSWLFALMPPVTADDDITITVDEVDSSSAPAARQLLAPIEDVIHQLTNNAPELVVNRSRPQIDTILRSLLKGFECEINYIKAADIEKIKARNTEMLKFKASIYPVIKLDHNKILYIRIDSFSRETTENVSKELEQVSSSDMKNISGVVVDLRQCRGYNINETLHVLYNMCHPDKLPYLKHLTPKRMLKKPVAVLICGNTSGSAEFFARKIKESKTGLTIGKSTVGKPFECEFVKLQNGDYLSIPKFPAGVKSYKVFPVQPMIPVACSSPQFKSDFKKLKSTGKLTGDSQLRRACDLLVSLSALKFDFNQNALSK